MIGCTIDSIGTIINDAPVNGAVNPHECHDYIHSVLFTDNDIFCTHIRWYIEGDIPVGISIDEHTGIISGNIKTFDKQPSCQDNHPLETIKIDGSNWMMSGRYKHETYLFNFTVFRDYYSKNELVTLCEEHDDINLPILETATSDVAILVIKSNNIDNYLFCKNYLEAGYKMNIGTVEYDANSVAEFINKHPGPFPNCKE